MIQTPIITSAALEERGPSSQRNSARSFRLLIPSAGQYGWRRKSRKVNAGRPRPNGLGRGMCGPGLPPGRWPHGGAHGSAHRRGGDRAADPGAHQALSRSHEPQIATVGGISRERPSRVRLGRASARGKGPAARASAPRPHTSALARRTHGPGPHAGTHPGQRGGWPGHEVTC